MAVLLASSGCAQHCEWTPIVEESSWATADGTITGGDRDGAFEGAVARATSDGVARLRFDVLTEEPATNGIEVHVWSLPAGVGTHEIDASVIWPDGARVETLGSVSFDEYAESSEQNPNDAYTSGGTVTAIQVAGTMSLVGETDGLRIELALAFDVEEDLRRECFDCPGIEGCDY